MKSSARFGATLLSLVLAVLVAAPLPAALCKVGSGASCPLMRGAEGAMCHRPGAMVRAMDCCQRKGASAPASAGDSVGPASPLALAAGDQGAPVAAFALAADLPSAEVAALRAAESLHELGLFTLLEVFRN